MLGYYRIELDADLDIDEVAPLLIDASKGHMQRFQPKNQKTTDGKLDKEGTHYSSYNWVGRTCTRGTDSGPRKHTTIGITDFEFFGNRRVNFFGHFFRGSHIGHKLCGVTVFGAPWRIELATWK